MSFFCINTSKNNRWATFLLGLAVVTLVSTSAIAYIKHPSKHTAPIPDTVIIDKVFVDKSARLLQLLSADTVVRSYQIALGDDPIGHKQQEGDERTPVGTYTLDYKNENSIAHRSIHISYPNAADKARAAALGVSAGGDIMIHGQMNGFGAFAGLMQRRDWTNGCIAVTNDEMDTIMAAIEIGTPIEIVE